MEVHLVRLDQSFPGGPPGTTLAPHDSLASVLDLIDAQTRTDVAKMRFLDDARRCLVGRLLAKFVLAERANVSHRSFGFEKSLHGRPYATFTPDLKTTSTPQPCPRRLAIDHNVSHDSNLVGVATAPLVVRRTTTTRRGRPHLDDDRDRDGVVGIDLMRIANPWPGSTIAEFIEGISDQLTDRERSETSRIESERDKLVHVLALWTLKEAYVKATGKGLCTDLTQISFDLDSTWTTRTTVTKVTTVEDGSQAGNDGHEGEGDDIVIGTATSLGPADEDDDEFGGGCEFQLVRLVIGGTGGEEAYWVAVAHLTDADADADANADETGRVERGGRRRGRATVKLSTGTPPPWLEFVDWRLVTDRFRNDDR